MFCIGSNSVKPLAPFRSCNILIVRQAFENWLRLSFSLSYKVSYIGVVGQVLRSEVLWIKAKDPTIVLVKTKLDVK